MTQWQAMLGSVPRREPWCPGGIRASAVSSHLGLVGWTRGREEGDTKQEVGWDWASEDQEERGGVIYQLGSAFLTELS